MPRIVECRLVDQPASSKPVCFEAPAVVRTGGQLKRLLTKLDRQADSLPSLILRLYDAAAGGYALLSDEQVLPADGLIRIALQRARANATPLAAVNAQAAAAAAGLLAPSPRSRGGAAPLAGKRGAREGTPAERPPLAPGKRGRPSPAAERPHDTLATSRHASAAAALLASGSPGPPAYHDSPDDPSGRGAPAPGAEAGGDAAGAGPLPAGWVGGACGAASEFFVRRTDVLEYPFSTIEPLDELAQGGGLNELLISTSAML